MVEDKNAGNGIVLYRLKLVYTDKTTYTNTVSLKQEINSVQVYPNPVKERVNISLASESPTDYQIELVNSAGHLVFSDHKKSIRSATIVYSRSKNLQPGMYLLRIINLNTNTPLIHKLLFE